MRFPSTESLGRRTFDPGNGLTEFCILPSQLKPSVFLSCLKLSFSSDRIATDIVEGNHS